MTIRTVIVGLSWIAADPAAPASDPVLGTAMPFSHASALAAIAETTVVAGCDIVPAARERFITNWGARWPGVKTYADYREMILTEKPDLVCVVTPDHLHHGVVLVAIEAGAKMIFCEKPLSTSLAEADAMVAATRAAGVTMSVNYTRRWFPNYCEARRIVRDGEIGKLSQIVAISGGPRAMLWRNHTHLIDLMNFLADDEPEWVVAELERGFEGYGTTYAGDGGNDPATEPGANFYIAYRNGVRAYVTGVKDTPPGEPMVTLLGPDGRVVIDLMGMRKVSFGAGDVRVGGVPIVTTAIDPKATVSGMEAAIRDLIAAHAAGRDPQSPPEVARRTVAVTDAILLSQQRGNIPVRLSELAPGAAR